MGTNENGVYFDFGGFLCRTICRCFILEALLIITIVMALAGMGEVHASACCYADAESAELTVLSPRTNVQFNLKPQGYSVPELFLPLILHTFSKANSPTPTHTPTVVPPTVTPTPTQPVASGIYGKVTDKGQVAASVQLKLRFFDGYSWSTAKTTTTDGDGHYRFFFVGSLGSGQLYSVRYEDDSDDTRVYFWHGPDIASYSDGANVHGGDFDIEDIVLLSPSSGSTQSLPTTFQWLRRGNSGESYRLYLFDPDSDVGWKTDHLGDVSSYILGELPDGAEYGRVYGWYMRVYQGEDSYGESYYSSAVTFVASATQREGSDAGVAWTPMQKLPTDRPVMHELMK